MSFDLDKLQAVAELGEVIRLHNDAIERLTAFRRARPHMMMPNLAKMVEENLKENVQVLYKELNNLHKPAEQQTRYICEDCHMAFLVKLPGGICDECRARRASKPRDYTVHATPVDMNVSDEPEIVEPPSEGDALVEDASLSEQAAEEVASDLQVADAMPRTDVDGNLEDEPSASAPAEDNDGYALTMDEGSDFSFEDLLSEDAGEEISQARDEVNDSPRNEKSPDAKSAEDDQPDNRL